MGMPVMKMLVVDDSQTMLLMIRKHLQAMGFSNEQILTCNSGQQAINILDVTGIQLVLLDWHIPDLSGLDILKIIKNYRKRTIPVIMITTEQERKNIAKAIDSGVDDYLIKPVDPVKLCEKIIRIGRKYGFELPGFKDPGHVD